MMAALQVNLKPLKRICVLQYSFFYWDFLKEGGFSLDYKA